MSRIERDYDHLFTGPVFAQEETQTTFVLPCRYEGGVSACNRAPTLPGGNSTERGRATSESTTFKPCDPVWLLPTGNSRVSTGIISGRRTLKDYELVIFCRDLIIKSELVTTDGIETDRFYKFDGAIVVVLTILTASRQKMSDAERHLCYRKGRC